MRAIQLRRTSQTVALLGFLWLFIATEYRGHDELPYPVGLLFRLDPLALLADLLAPGGFNLALLWPALLLLIATLVFGRFFCGWICPLGTLYDLVRWGKQDRVPTKQRRQRLKYYLLATLSVSALFGVQLFGIVDPLSIFLRSLTFSLYPIYNLAANGVFDIAYDQQIGFLNDLYPIFRDHLMAFVQPAFHLSLFTLVVLLLLLLLELKERRFWCKYLCPLGALLGLAASANIWRRTPAGFCVGCHSCAEHCRTGATSTNEVDTGEGGDSCEGAVHSKQECILCLECVDSCPSDRLSFKLDKPSTGSGVDLTRRGVIGSLAAGAVVAPTIQIAPSVRRENPYLIRPPGAVDEDEFLQRCIRCGECMKVCIGQALQPSLNQAGPIGLWTPLLVARLGYCEYNCTLCGQVCPTGALKKLSVEEKRKWVIGLAVFDKDRCLPFARGEECLVCEEHCPTGEKAIVFDEKQVLVGSEPRTLKFPRVIKKRCIGCGICETKCPVAGTSAIRIIHEGETRRKEDEWV